MEGAGEHPLAQEPRGTAEYRSIWDSANRGSPRQQQQQAICNTACRGLHLGGSRWVRGLHGDPIALITPHGSLAGAPFPLMSLPSALLGSILSLLDYDDGQQTGPKARAAVRLSSKSLRDAYDACNTKIKLGCTDGTPPLVFRTTRSKGRASAHASYLDMALFLIARTPCLEDLSVCYYFSKRDEKGAKQLLSRLPVACLLRLKRREIEQSFDEAMLSPLKHCSSLHELKVWVNDRPALATLYDALIGFTVLRHLEFSGNHVDVDKLANCTGLESLTLRSCSDLRTLSSLTALKRLSIQSVSLPRKSLRIVKIDPPSE